MAQNITVNAGDPLWAILSTATSTTFTSQPITQPWTYTYPVTNASYTYPQGGLGTMCGSGLGGFQVAPTPPVFLPQPGDPNCLHEAWEILPFTPAGYGHCQNCGGDYTLDVLMHGLRDRMLHLIRQLEARLAD